MSANDKPVVLAIAGFDPSAGAGILADIKTISAFECYGLGVVTSFTIQNTREVLAAYHQQVKMIRAQLEALFGDFEIAAVKIGMLPTEDAVREVESVLSSNRVEQLVVDPVARSSSGYDLVDEPAFIELTKLLIPRAALVTPNWQEAERITGIAVRDGTSAEQAGKAILALGPRAVLLTGGDVDADIATDLLVDELGTRSYAGPRMQTRNTHGTGCALASAVACLLARGITLRDSVSIAKDYVRQAIATAPNLGHGNGPLNHFPPDWKL